MEDNTILTKANIYVKNYKDSLDNNNSITRSKIDSSMLVIFLGDDLDDCRIACENTMNNLWCNCDSEISFCNIRDNNSNDIQSVINKFTNNLFQNSESEKLQVNIVTKTCLKLADRIFDIISCVCREFSFSFNSIDFYIYSIFEKTGKKAVEDLSVHLSTIENYVFNRINNHCVYSIIVGDKLTNGNNLAFKDAVASSIVLTNEKNITADYGISNKSHCVIGFSQADIPLETIYIIGFDIFSDIVIDYFRNIIHKKIENNRFDIKQNLIQDYLTKVDSIKQQLKDNSKYLWHNNSLSKGEYLFSEIDEEYGNTLLTYFTANLRKKNILLLDDKDITQRFNKYLLNYFKNCGLIEARKHLETITNQEKEKQSQPTYITSEYINKAYSYDNNNPHEALGKIIDDMANAHINELIRKIRNIIISIGESNDNVLENIEKIFKSLEACTEKCKQESVYRDKSLNGSIKSVYETVINDRKNDIHNQLKELAFDYTLFASEEKFSDFIFNEYEKKIVDKYLFVNLKNYTDDTNLFDGENIPSWIKRQCDNAELSMAIASADTLQIPLFLTDIVKNDKFRNNSKLATYLINNNCNYVSVSGIPIFRTLCFRTVNQRDLTLIQRLNSCQEL